MVQGQALAVTVDADGNILDGATEGNLVIARSWPGAALVVDAAGQVITPQRAQFAATQREVIERLARLGLV